MSGPLAALVDGRLTHYPQFNAKSLIWRSSHDGGVDNTPSDRPALQPKGRYGARPAGVPRHIHRLCDRQLRLAPGRHDEGTRTSTVASSWIVT